MGPRSSLDIRKSQAKGTWLKDTLNRRRFRIAPKLCPGDQGDSELVRKANLSVCLRAGRRMETQSGGDRDRD